MYHFLCPISLLHLKNKAQSPSALRAVINIIPQQHEAVFAGQVDPLQILLKDVREAVDIAHCVDHLHPSVNRALFQPSRFLLIPQNLHT